MGDRTAETITQNIQAAARIKTLQPVSTTSRINSIITECASTTVFQPDHRLCTIKITADRVLA